MLFSLPNYFMLTTGHVTDPVLETIGDNETELQVTVTMTASRYKMLNVEF